MYAAPSLPPDVGPVRRDSKLFVSACDYQRPWPTPKIKDQLRL